MADELLSTTESLCPECLRKIPAARMRRGETVFLEKTCPDHGAYSVPVWRGLPDFRSWVRPKVPAETAVPFTSVEKGCPFDCGLCPGHRQHTCTALLEVTGRCNLQCGFCFAGAGKKGADPDAASVRGWYQRLLDAGGPCNVQLSGGEPTVRDDLPELVAMGRSMGFGFIQLNTNGLRLGREPGFLDSLQRAGLSSVFLQFDGTEREIHRRMRGGDFLAEKLEAIRLCGERGIGVILVPTVVPGINDHNLGAIIKLALSCLPAVRGVHFQPVSYFGRYPRHPGHGERITLPEIITKIESQTGGLVRAQHFRPPGCENALCSFSGSFICTEGGELVPTAGREAGRARTDCCGRAETAVEGAEKARSYVAARWVAPPTAGGGRKCCGGGRGPADSLDVFLEGFLSRSFTISGMAFQDAWNIDLDRLKDCCIHVVSPGGKIIPFCAYNLTDKSGRPLYRDQVF